MVSKRLVSKLGLVDKIFKVPSQIVKGLDDATICLSEAVRLNVVFEDQADRWIDCLVCAQVPHELLLGLPFMVKHNITFVPAEGAFQLMDSVVDRVVSSTSGLHGNQTVLVIQKDGEKGQDKDGVATVIPLKHPEGPFRLLSPVLPSFPGRFGVQ